MGSYGRAIMVGFMCRLCSEHKQNVIHLYGSKAKKMKLLQKIKLIPIKINKYDKLPKTVCEQCILKLEIQYQFIERVRRNANGTAKGHLEEMDHENEKCPGNCPLKGTMLESTCPFSTIQEKPNSIGTNT